MDVGGSFLELACVRIAVIPAGPALPEHRFEELTSHLAAFREVPVNALPRRAAVSRPASSASFSSVSSLTPAMREALAEPKSLPLARSFSSVRDASKASRPPVFPTFVNAQSSSADVASSSAVAPLQAESRSAPALVSATPVSKIATPPPASPRFNSDLDLTGPDVDSSFRMRYEVIHRDHAGALIMRPFSEWDDFHSTKVWGVFGIVDCTMAVGIEGTKSREAIVADAATDFRASLAYFKQAAVRRLIVFTHTDAEHNGPFVLNEPLAGKESSVPMPFSVGHVPEREKSEDTKLEARAQVIHFAGLLLNEIDRECWRRRESPASELFLSPIDENLTSDRQSKLAKRRAGRLDKLLGDSLLLMGSPSDALVKYSSAMERSKASSDRLWLAGSMEGWSAAHVLSHVGNGGSANDKALTDKLIEHYGEIYKLYQKKRVAEPEAAAAMRLAEFLSRWTSRRKEALDAAQHAATVGEGLRTAKRAALWEALARFSDRMGCRRKAAFYLYRLGQLNATQGVLSSAVTLMIAAERQLCIHGRKPWASLNRRVLLTAAKHAEDTGDSNAAAKLNVEALVISSSMSDRYRGADAAILKSLDKAQVPSYLPAASGILVLEEVVACQMEGLTIRQREGITKSDVPKAVQASKDGPFIYNPFEAKKRAKAEADTKRMVTWVCEESALVCLRIVSNIAAEYVMDIVAVLFNDAKQESGVDAVETENAARGNVDERTAGGDELIDGGGVGDEDSLTSRHAENVRVVLEQSTKLAHTVPAAITIHPHDSVSCTKYVTVVPRKTGQLFIEGVLVRLFNGALVILRSIRKGRPPTDEPPVNVMPKLPNVSVSARCVEGEYGDSGSGGNSIVVYDGEKRWLWVEVRNCGTEKITWMKARVVWDDNAAVEVTQDELSGEQLLDGLQEEGSTRTFRLQILGRWRRRNNQGKGASAMTLMSTLSIHVEYEASSSSMGTTRESSTTVRIACRPAVRVGGVTMFAKCGQMKRQKSDTASQIEYCMGVDVTNYVSVPARVVVVGSKKTINGGANGDAVANTDVSSEECLVEHGACARQVCNVGDGMAAALKRLACERCERSGRGAELPSDVIVRWSLPAMGREGVVAVGMDEVRRAAKQLWSVCGGGTLARAAHCSIGGHVEIQLRMVSALKEGSSGEAVASQENVLNVGCFQSVVIEISNTCEDDLPDRSLLDVELVQRNASGAVTALHRANLVGVTKRVYVGALSQGGKRKFQHEVKVRVASKGCFQVLGYLYDGDADVEAVTDEVGPVEEVADEAADSVTGAKTEDLVNGVYDSERERKNGDGQDINIIYPRTMDSFLLGRSARRRRRAPLAVSMLEFLAVRDGSRVIER